jgi:hypothetical protein
MRAMVRSNHVIAAFYTLRRQAQIICVLAAILIIEAFERAASAFG